MSTPSSIDEVLEQLVGRLGQQGYQATYPDETAFEADVWPRVVTLAQDIGFECLTSHSVHSGRSAVAWEEFCHEPNGPDVRVLGAKNRLDIVLRDRGVGSIGIEIKCLGASGHPGKLTRALGQAVLGLANRDRAIVLIHCGTVTETERAELRDVGRRILDKSRVTLIVVP